MDPEKGVNKKFVGSRENPSRRLANTFKSESDTLVNIPFQYLKITIGKC
jgi:hypothetical protein